MNLKIYYLKEKHVIYLTNTKKYITFLSYDAFKSTPECFYCSNENIIHQVRTIFHSSNFNEFLQYNVSEDDHMHFIISNFQFSASYNLQQCLQDEKQAQLLVFKQPRAHSIYVQYLSIQISSELWRQIGVLLLASSKTPFHQILDHDAIDMNLLL